jgi:hypothetical protein
MQPLSSIKLNLIAVYLCNITWIVAFISLSYRNMSVKKGKGLNISLPENYDIGYLPINQMSNVEFIV